MTLRRHSRALLPVLAVMLVGLISLGYLFVKQGGPVPLRDTYEIQATFTSADGVISGLGQPVNVAGVDVGTVTKTRVSATGNAVVTLEIQRRELPAVYRNARVTLEPITPLKDMQVVLDPGTPRAKRLAAGGSISVSRTTSPTELSNILGALDGDTRAYLTTLISALDRGTKGRAIDTRLLFRALGPATAQTRQLAQALASRRRELARLVHNIADVTVAASQDRQLTTVVRASRSTLHAISAEDPALQRALDRLPATLRATRSSLRSSGRFFDALTPALGAVSPAIEHLPGALEASVPLARSTASALRQEIRPLVTDAQPLLRDLAPATQDLAALTSPITSVLRTTTYALNELAYNPPGNDEGILFWLGFAFHNFGSAFTFGDAHGSIGRAMVMLTCPTLSASIPGSIARLITGSGSLCKGTN